MRLPKDDLEKLLEKAENEIFVSVINSMTEPQEDFQSGPHVTFSVLNALRRVRREFLLHSSAAVYGEPKREQLIGFQAEVTLEAGVESFAHWCKAEILGF